jgi:hypothetical protein
LDSLEQDTDTHTHTIVCFCLMANVQTCDKRHSSTQKRCYLFFFSMIH